MALLIMNAFGMRVTIYSCLIALAVLILISCTDVTPTRPTGSATLGILPSATPDLVPSKTPQASVTPTTGNKTESESPQNLQRALYTLTAELDYGLHLLDVEQEIIYTNNTADPLNEVLLMVEPQNYSGVFNLITLGWGEGLNETDARWEGNKLILPMSDPLLQGEDLEISISYQLKLPSPDPNPELRPIPFGYTARQTNLVDWYPFVPPYISGKGWLAHDPGYFGEHLVYEKADFQVNIRLRASQLDLVIAASSPAEIDGGWHRYEHLNARNFVWSVSHQYQVTREIIGDVVVLGYTFPFDQIAGAAVLQTTAEAVDLYQELFGPYPRKQLSVVEADFLDGMEFDGLYFLSNGFYNLYQGTKEEYLIAIAAHETAHQWWYAQVGNDQALEPWLDEAMCTYSERLFYERLYPEALDWWWQYRINYYDPQGWVDRSIYEPGGYRSYRDAVYLNGAVFLEELRGLIGDQTFFDFLNIYRKENMDQISTTRGFFNLLNSQTDVDTSPLVDLYFNKDIYK